MKAIILLKTNPGFQTEAYATFEEVTKSSPTKGVKPLTTLHCFGRFDGAIVCDYNDPKALGALAEALRKNGVFHTETLIAID